MADVIKNSVGERLKAWHGEDWHNPKGRIIRDVVYAIDTGLVTTVSFLAGASAAFVARKSIVLAGFIQIISGTLAIFFRRIHIHQSAEAFF